MSTETAQPRAAAGERTHVRVWICALILLLSTVAYADRSILSISGSGIKDEFGLTTVQLGFVLSAFSWAYVIGQVPGGNGPDLQQPVQVHAGAQTHRIEHEHQVLQDDVTCGSGSEGAPAEAAKRSIEAPHTAVQGGLERRKRVLGLQAAGAAVALQVERDGHGSFRKPGRKKRHLAERREVVRRGNVEKRSDQAEECVRFLDL